MINYASAADLLSRVKRRYVDADVCGMKVRLQSITAGEYAQIERKLIAAASNAKGTTEAKRAQALIDGNALLVRYSAVNAEGLSLFNETEARRLAEVDAQTMKAMVAACMEHCGLSGNDLEEIAKNSVRTAADATPTA